MRTVKNELAIINTALNETKNTIQKWQNDKILPNKKLEKQCFVLIQKKNDQNFDFSFSNVKYEDFLIFNYSDTIFYVKLLKIKKK